MVTLTGNITDVTGKTPESISNITVKAPAARIGGGSDIIVTSPAKVTFDKTTGTLTLSGLHVGLSWLYLEGDGWSDSIPLAVAEGFQLILEAVANASGIPGIADYVSMIRNSGDHARLLARAAMDGEFGGVVRLAQTAATTAAQAATTADTRAATAEAAADNAVSRVEALEAMAGIGPESPVDGQTANLVSQPGTLTRAAVGQNITQHTGIYLVDDFGAVGDGAVDDTAAWQAAVDYVASHGGGTVSGSVNKIYMINSDAGASVWNDQGGISMKSGVDIYLPGSCTLRAIPVTTTVAKIIRVHDQENIRIHGTGTVDGNRDNSVHLTGEWKHGIAVNAGKNITVEGICVINCRGDGINFNYLSPATPTPPENIVVRGVECRNNYRQGLVIGAGKNMLVENSVFAETNGISPQSGLDVETSTSDAVVDAVTIRKNIFEKNAGAGVMVWENTRGNMNGITIEDNTLIDNGLLGASSQGGPAQANIGMSGNSLIFQNNNVKAGTVGQPALDFKSAEYGSVVSGNVLEGDVRLSGSGWISGYPSGLNFSGNIVRGGTTFGHNAKFTITGNSFYPPAGKVGIQFVGAAVWQGSITYNHFEGGDSAIDLRNESKPPSNISIIGNIFKDTLSTAIYQLGIHNRVEDNLFWGCCLTSGQSIIHVPSGSGALASPVYIRNNIVRIAPFNTSLATQVPSYFLTSEPRLNPSGQDINLNGAELTGNKMSGPTKWFPDDMPSYANAIIAGAGNFPVRASEYRPRSVPAGTQFFDTTLNQLLTFSGVSWRDGAGTIVP